MCVCVCVCVFVCVQTDTPEDMKGWIKDISSKIQDFRGPSKVNILKVIKIIRLQSLIFQILFILSGIIICLVVCYIQCYFSYFSDIVS